MSKYEMCNDNRFEIIRELKNYIIEATNIDTSPKEMEVLDNFCFRLWQLGLTLETKNKLKSLEKENQELKEENNNLKKALDKACERLEWGCPVEQDLIDDLDCENCKNTEKECWKKYFLKEVFENEC